MNSEIEGNPAVLAKPPKKVTNQTVLMVTTFLFAAFVVAEIIGALAGNSLSLLGDAAAMSVDVFTVRILSFQSCNYHTQSLDFPIL